MKKTYLEIGSSVGAVIMFIVLIILINKDSPGYAAYGNVLALLAFVIAVGTIGLKLAQMQD